MDDKINEIKNNDNYDDSYYDDDYDNDDNDYNDDDYEDIKVINNSYSIVKFTLSYWYKKKEYVKNSNQIFRGMNEEIKLPERASNVHVLVNILDKLNKWYPIYNYNFLDSRELKLVVSGERLIPKCTDITGDDNFPTTPPKFYVVTENSGSFSVRFYVSYEYGGKSFKVDSNSFLQGLKRSITLPPRAKNINIEVEMKKGFKWESIFLKKFKSVGVFKLLVSGTVNSPECGLVSSIPDTDENVVPLISFVKTPSVETIYLNKILRFTINISNNGGITAKRLILKDRIPEGAKFIPNSLIVDEERVNGNDFPIEGINLEDLEVYDEETITYSVIFKEIPKVNPVYIKPSLKYEYCSGLCEDKTETIKGKTIPVTVKKQLNIVPSHKKELIPLKKNISSSIKVLKKPMVTKASLCEIVTYQILVANNSDVTIDNVVLKDSIPENSVFIPNSLSVNGNVVFSKCMPSDGIKLNKIKKEETTIINYKVKITTMPIINPVLNEPILKYTYITNSGNNQSIIIKGTSELLTITKYTKSYKPSLRVVKSPNTQKAILNEKVTFVIVISNCGPCSAKDSVLKDTISENAVFIPNSLTLNGQISDQNMLLNSSIHIGNIKCGETKVISYEVMFSSIPQSNVVAVTPSLKYSYDNNLGENEIVTFEGRVIPITIINNN